MMMLCLGLSPALPCGRTECVPPRKPPVASSPDIPRKAICNALATPRRGGLRTPAMRELASPEHVPSRPPGVRLPPMIMLCLGMGEASQCGRAERVPPRKPPSALAPGFPREAISLGLSTPGGAGFARPQYHKREAPSNHNWHEGLSLFSSPGRVGKKRGRRFAVRNSPIPQ